MSKKGAGSDLSAVPLRKVVDWLQKIQMDHPDTVRSVSDDAVYGLQVLHTIAVREIMQRMVDKVECAENKKRKHLDTLQEVHEELQLREHLQTAKEIQKNQQPMAKTKAQNQNKRARKVAMDPKLAEQQECMLQQARERALQQHSGRDVNGK